MSKSRLEKFLYALYSLDSSDLPSPLSRIEELYKCLVTGDEAPTFEPLSRVEKYLMAILGGYDVELLPSPLSRVEVLLYKLATGDDNLDDVKSFLSEHEELLAEIIRNGSSGGNIDIEYVLYTLSTEFNTLYNTAEKPVKSAILKGSTLVNLLNKLTVNGEVEQTTSWYTTTYTTGTLKSGTYILLYHVKETSGTTTRNTPGIGLASGTYLYHGYDDFNTTTGIKKWIFTTDEDSSKFGYWLTNNTGKVVVEDFILLEYQEGMENWDIPFFEGIQSVKMPVLTTTGKNLFDMKNSNFITEKDGNYYPSSDSNLFDTYTLLPNTAYTISGIFDGWGKCFINGVNLGNFSSSGSRAKKKFTTDSTGMTTIYFGANNSNDASKPCYDFQLEIGDAFTSYEPYKSNILTCNEEVTIRGIGDVKDELNLLTGELTSSLGEVVLDGTQKRMGSQKWGNYTKTRFEIIGAKDTRSGGDDVPLMSDKLKPYGYWGEADNGEYFFTGNNYIDIVHSNEKDIAKWLKDNPTLIIYPLIESTVKTVDLSVVNQDGNDTELSTFDDITHVTLSSEGLIPEAELEVATKNEEDLEDTSVYTVHTLSEEFNTLYNTAEKPVKSAILKGQTLVNRVSSYGFGGDRLLYEARFFDNPFQKGETLTIFVVNPNATTIKVGIYSAETGNWSREITYDVSINKKINYIVPNNSIVKYVGVVVNNANDSSGFENSIVVVNGDQSHLNINTYFDGMQSVKMPVLTVTNGNLLILSPTTLEMGSISGTTGELLEGNTRCHTTKIKVSQKDDLFLKRINCNYQVAVRYYYGDTLVNKSLNNNGSFIVDGNLKVNGGEDYDSIKLIFAKSDNSTLTIEEVANQQIMLVPNNNYTTYEPHKSNILTTNEEVELRGIGDVKDELNLMTGELTQRVGEVVFDGSEDWTNWGSQVAEGMCGMYTRTNVENIASGENRFLIICDTLPISFRANLSNTTYDSIIKGSDYIGITMANKTVEEIKAYLKSNPLTVQYQLKEKVVKTVDLSVVDQDGDNTKLSTFDDVTHVTLSSEGLIPEAELEVAEKVPEVAANMFTISREQEVINTTINEQSENVDATMIATTEIYEELL